MSSQVNQGRHEIEAAKKRLGAAKKQELAAKEMRKSAREANESAKIVLQKLRVEMAEADKRFTAAKKNYATSQKNEETTKSMRDLAVSQVSSSIKEREEAEACLREAEKRWEVIDVDVEEENTGTKKRKTGDAPAHQSNNVSREPSPIADNSGASNNNDAGDARQEQETFANIVYVVEVGSYCFGSEYRKIDQLHDGVPMYHKRGVYNNTRVDMIIYRQTHRGAKHWFIAIPGHEPVHRTLNSMTSAPRGETRWIPAGTTRPAPGLAR